MATGRADLFRKLEADPLVVDYSCYGFFPTIYPRLYQQGERPQVWFDGRTRGRVALFGFANGAGIVVKPLQNRREAELAQLAGEAEVGPQQLESLEGFLVEELVPGRFFTDLSPDDLRDEFVHQIGLRLGSMLSTLHSAGICYNDATLSDPDGRSHLLVQLPTADQTGQSPKCRLIDFRVSRVLLDNFPALEMEEVFNMVQELHPSTASGVPHGPCAGSEFRRFLAQYRQRLPCSISLGRKSCPATFAFTEEGLQQAAAQDGKLALVDPFQAGL